ncbi:kinase-like domain-containing protein [Phanerochaete sordida]|uniref:Kinase-like domain-containing protein n=1 Tax=Phanerochaete sordida TaxID=48140 RepID=A0A9P3LAA2_9APHY|nr:kinase-like domain-containing protein [Phanerochaete sordida]
MRPPIGSETMANGFAYATSQRGLGEYYNYERWEYTNPLCRAARTDRGQDVIIRVTVVGQEGQDHLSILRKVARGQLSLFSDNHVLPLLDEIMLGDITFCVFPRAGLTLHEAYGGWARNSAGDVVDMILQALEGLAFLHNQRIAHQDAFKSNFMVEWMPESLRSTDLQVSRPRVYIIDLETAVEFPEACPLHERRCARLKLPLGVPPEEYARPVPPEILDGQPFDPFKVDVWQFGTGFSSFKSTIAPIDQVLVSLTDPDASSRPSASEALSRLAECVNAMPPKDLRIKPDFPPLPFEIDDT